MGKAMLIVALLMGTIYGGIMLHLQNKMLDLPQLQVRQIIEKEQENVNDFALRGAIRYAERLREHVEAGNFVNLKLDFHNYRIGNCLLDRIEYKYAGETANSVKYRAVSYVHGDLQGYRVNPDSTELALTIPLNTAGVSGIPNCFYLEMEDNNFRNGDLLADGSGNNPPNNPTVYGGVAGNINQTIHPFNKGLYKWCTMFGHNKTVETENYGWLSFPGSSSTRVDRNFSLISFVRMNANSTVSTIVWLASDPYPVGNNLGIEGPDLRLKPTAAIYYKKVGGVGKMYFTVTNTAYQQLIISTPFTPAATFNYNKQEWFELGLTYKKGLLKAYINGMPVTPSEGDVWQGAALPALTSNYGFSLGRRDLRDGTADSDYYTYNYFWGEMDQVGLYSRTLTDSQMKTIYEAIIAEQVLPVDTYIVSAGPPLLNYIRD